MHSTTRDPLADIADAAEALCDPRQHSEPRYEYDHNRHKKPTRPHLTTVPGLIQQLREAAEPGADGDAGGKGGAESVPVAIDAVSLLAAITFGVKWRTRQWGVDTAQRDTVEDHIRGLVGAATRRDSDEQRSLRAELRSWQHQAEVVTGWKAPSRPLPAPCPHCDARGSLLAKADGSGAACIACLTKWGEDSVGVLARHVSDYRARAEAASRDARARAVAERRRREGNSAA